MNALVAVVVEHPKAPIRRGKKPQKMITTRTLLAPRAFLLSPRWPPRFAAGGRRREALPRARGAGDSGHPPFARPAREGRQAGGRFINTSQRLRRVRCRGRAPSSSTSSSASSSGRRCPGGSSSVERQSPGVGVHRHREGLRVHQQPRHRGRRPSFTVTMADGREFAAKLIGTDPKTDVALAQDSSSPQTDFPYVNRSATATGSRSETGWSRSEIPSGSVSRSPTGWCRPRSDRSEPVRMTTSSRAMRSSTPETPGPGSSSLARERWASTPPCPRGQGIGFAVPDQPREAALARSSETGKIVRGPRLGVSASRALTPDLARSLNPSSSKGALVAQVVKRGDPPRRAGSKSGTWSKLNNAPVSSAFDPGRGQICPRQQNRSRDHPRWSAQVVQAEGWPAARG